MAKRFLVAGVFLAGLVAGCTGRAAVGLTQSAEVGYAIAHAAQEHGVQEWRLRCLAQRESTYRPWVTSGAGYMGLYQYDWPTWRYGSRLAGYAGASPYDAWAAAHTTALLIARGEGRRWPPLRWCGGYGAW